MWFAQISVELYADFWLRRMARIKPITVVCNFGPHGTAYDPWHARLGQSHWMVERKIQKDSRVEWKCLMDERLWSRSLQKVGRHARAKWLEDMVGWPGDVCWSHGSL